MEYKFSDPVKAVYESRQPVEILKNISQSCIRNVIGTYEVDSVLTIPEYAIEFSGDSVFVYVLNVKDSKPKEKYIKTQIKIGLSDGFFVQVTEGLKKEQKIRGKAFYPAESNPHLKYIL